MPSINSSNLFNTVTSEFQIRKLVNADPNKFTQSVLQISDQQSRDKNYETGLTWLRTYISSLQAKLNTVVEELNGIYENMLNELLYRRASSKNSSLYVNGYENADFNACMPDKGITPYTKYVRNYQYNPYFGARAFDLTSKFNSGENKDSSVARTYYNTIDNSHHEFGAAAFGTLGYLWMWDVDRINASYASTLDRYMDENGNMHVPSTINGVANPAINVNAGIIGDDSLVIKDGTNPEKFQVNITALQPNRGVFAPETEEDPNTVTYVLKEGFENDGVISSVNLWNPLTNTYKTPEDCKWQQAFKNPYDRNEGKMAEDLMWRIANNRAKTGGGSVHFGDITNENYNYEFYVLKDNAENVLPSNQQPFSTLTGPDVAHYDPLSGVSDTFDMYGIPANYPDPGQSSLPAGSPYVNPVNMYPANKDVGDSAGTQSWASSAIGGVAGSLDDGTGRVTDIKQSGVKINGNTEDSSRFKLDGSNHLILSNASNIAATDQFTEWHTVDERDTANALSSRWRTATNESYSGDHSYWFGNQNGNYGVAGYDGVAENQTVKMYWSGEGSYGHVDGLGIDFGWTNWEPNFDMQVDANTKGGPNMAPGGPGYGDSGTEQVTLTGASGYRYVFLNLEDHHGLWSTLFNEYRIHLDYTYTGAVANTSYNRGAVTWTNVANTNMQFGLNTTLLGWFDVQDPHDNWWGNGTYNSSANATNTQNDKWFPSGDPNPQPNPSQNMPGFMIQKFTPSAPEGIMTRKLDLTNLTGGDAEGLGYERLELRYKQNFQVEPTDADSNGTQYDKRYAIQSSNGSDFYTLDSKGTSGYGFTTAQLAGGTSSYAADQRSDIRDSSGGWESRYYDVSAAQWGTKNTQVGLFFDAGDQWENGARTNASGVIENNKRGWNVDDIEVVARGKSTGELISPTMDLSRYVTATLTYNSRMGSMTRAGTAGDMDPGDAIKVYYQNEDTPGVWTLLTSQTGQEKDDVTNSFVNAQGQLPGSGWADKSLDLACAAGKSKVRIKYVFETNADNNYGDGWNIDNVQVFGRKSASTDFYAYKTAIDQNFVSDTTNNAPETFNKNGMNISFDPKGTNYLGKYTIDNGRVEITNTDYPMFADTLLTSVEQDSAVYNRNLKDGYGAWKGDGLGATLVVDKTGVMKVTDNTRFVPDSIGRLINSDNEMYVDDAMAVNMGLAKDKIPTQNQIRSKDTGWVNYSVADKGLPYVAGTCFDEGTSVPGGSGTYEYMSTYSKKTVFSNGAQSGTITLNADQDAYLYVNGVKVSNVTPLPTGNPPVPGTRVYNVNLNDGFNTIAILHSEKRGPNSITMTSTLNDMATGASINLDDSWATKLWSGGYKGDDPITGSSYQMGADPNGLSGSINTDLFEVERDEVFAQTIEGMKSLGINFSNLDKNGVGKLSTIQSIELVATGEPTVQSYATSVWSTTTTTDDGSIISVLNRGYVNNKLILGDDPSGFNFGPKDLLGYTTDIDGTANVTLSVKNSAALANDATLMVKVNYYEDADQDGVIDIDTDRDGTISTTEFANATPSQLKTKYIGAEDTRDTKYYSKSSSGATAGYTGTVIPLSSATGGNKVADRFSIQGGVVKSNIDVSQANSVYGNYLVASKGKSGGADVADNKNILTARLKQLIDSDDFQEVMKFGLLDNIFLAATISDNRGDQITGKLILDWDWRRRRINIKQGSFSAIYKS